MAKLINLFVGWPLAKRLRTPDNDDEHVDRLNHRVTIGLILTGVAVTSTTSFVSNRISCWLPTELKHGSYIKYIEHYCWISNTYYIHSNVTPPHSDEDRRSAQIGYYQWVPFLLLLMGLCFYAPRLFWRSFNIRTGIDIQNLVKQNQKDSKNAVRVLEYYCHSFPSTRSSSSPFPISLTAYFRRGKHRGNYLFSIYFLTRFMYLINSILQLFLLNALLGHRGSAWFLDWDIIRSILRHGNPLLDSPYFPRVTLCDVPIREIAIIHRYTIQCALPINILNEKVFLALSFWFTYLIIHNVLSFILLLNQQTKHNRLEYIKRLAANASSTTTTDDTIELFAERYLTYDGLLILRLLSHNASELRAIEVVQAMLKNYRP